jgi:hypothetical protein
MPANRRAAHNFGPFVLPSLRAGHVGQGQADPCKTNGARGTNGTRLCRAARRIANTMPSHERRSIRSRSGHPAQSEPCGLTHHNATPLGRVPSLLTGFSTF